MYFIVFHGSKRDPINITVEKNRPLHGGRTHLHRGTSIKQDAIKWCNDLRLRNDLPELTEEEIAKVDW